MFQPIYHVSVSPTDGNGPTQGQRKTLTRVGIPGIVLRLCQWNLIWIEIVFSLSCIPERKAQDSGFHKQKFHGFQNPDSLT